MTAIAKVHITSVEMTISTYQIENVKMGDEVEDTSSFI
jgi:hypothetical protein